MVTETEEHTPSAMLRMSVSLRKRAAFRPGVHVREGESGTNPCTGALKERSDTGVSDDSWVSGSLDAREAEAGATSAISACNAFHCTAALTLTLTSSREQRARNADHDHSQHQFPLSALHARGSNISVRGLSCPDDASKHTACLSFLLPRAFHTMIVCFHLVSELKK